MSNYRNNDDSFFTVETEHGKKTKEIRYDKDDTETEIIKVNENNELKSVNYQNQLQQNNFQNQMTSFQNNQVDAFNQNQNQFNHFIIIGNTNTIKEFEVPERSIPPQQIPQLNTINSSFGTIDKDGEYYKNQKIDSKLNGFDNLKSDLNLQPSNFNEMKNSFKFNLTETERGALGRKMDFNTFFTSKDEKLIENYLKNRTYNEDNLGNFSNTPLFNFLKENLDHLKPYINGQYYNIFSPIIDILNGAKFFKSKFKDHVFNLINIYQNVYNSIMNQNRIKNNRNKNIEENIINTIIQLTDAYLNSITYKQVREKNIISFNIGFNAIQRLTLSLDNINLENINRNIDSIKNFVISNFSNQNSFNNNLISDLETIKNKINLLIDQSNINFDNIEILKSNFNNLKEKFNKQAIELEKQTSQMNNNLNTLNELSKNLSEKQDFSLKDIWSIQNYLQKFSGNIVDNINGQIGSILNNISFGNGSITERDLQNIRNAILQSIKGGIMQMLQMIYGNEKDISNLKKLIGEVEKLVKSVTTENLRDTVSGLENRMNVLESGFTQIKEGSSQSISSNQIKKMEEDYSTLKKDYLNLKEQYSTLKNNYSTLENNYSTLKEDSSKELKSINERLNKLEEKEEKMTKENEMGVKGIKQKKEEREEIKERKERKSNYSKLEYDFRKKWGPNIEELNKIEINTVNNLLKYISNFITLIVNAHNDKDFYSMIRLVDIFLENLNKYDIGKELNNKIRSMIIKLKHYSDDARNKNNSIVLILKYYGKDFEEFKNLIINEVYPYLLKLPQDSKVKFNLII